MCDIVNSPCKICNADLPLHLGDYDTAPEEVECFCSKHIPDTNVRVFTLTEDDKYEGTVSFPKGWVMGIRYLTDNARENREMNHPNVAANWSIHDLP